MVVGGSGPSLLITSDASAVWSTLPLSSTDSFSAMSFLMWLVFLLYCVPCRAVWKASVGHQVTAKFISPCFYFCNLQSFHDWAVLYLNFAISFGPFGSYSVVNKVILLAIFIKFFGYKLGSITRPNSNKKTMAGKYSIELVNHFLCGGRLHNTYFIVSAVVYSHRQCSTACLADL